MGETIRHYCSGEPIIDFQQGKTVVDWEEFGFLWDCFMDESVREHTDAADKNISEVWKTLYEHNILVPFDFVGEAYEVVIVPIVRSSTLNILSSPGMGPRPTKPFLRYSRNSVIRLINLSRNRNSRLILDDEERGIHLSEYLEYRIELIAGFFKSKEDAIACARGYKNYKNKARRGIGGEVQVRKVTHLSKDEQRKYGKYTKVYLSVIPYEEDEEDKE